MHSIDQPIDRHTLQTLTRAIQIAAPHAELAALRAAAGQIEPLSLRQRADLLRDALLTDLPGDFASLARTVSIARDDAPHFTGWLLWPVTSALATRAVRDGSTEAFDGAMTLLADLTSRFSSEFALRTLLRHDLDRALDIIVSDWTASAHADVRRLAAEGTRPYLPWTVRVPRIMAGPGVTAPVLDALYRDESEYVRHSVANHLNDLSREHPDAVVDTARRWLACPDVTTGRLVRRGLRTLVKRGHPGALKLLGFAPATLEVGGPFLDRKTVVLGDCIRFTAFIRNTSESRAQLVIDYVVYYRRAGGGQAGRPFRLTSRTLAPGEQIEVERSHSFRPRATRRHHPGRHSVSLWINGSESTRADFELLEDQA
ncbi:DNA alkylation repair protein [Streptomyces kunmingensis]|uniref:DNA alkylation repair protein n=1 Tax=Streptomyces kunmingensis TaxID=68225 RepID=A0ABU6CGI6_9ACTN|nr:DNA alkylation repair protein [Streptomyces kunmingensis]MEB3963005.1 DNA alkylation repair protein [Streptomyces kunmingensis]